jgi:hypothetical protein
MLSEPAKIKKCLKSRDLIGYRQIYLCTSKLENLLKALGLHDGKNLIFPVIHVSRI